MKQFFCDDTGALSMGRLLTFVIAMNSIIILNIAAFVGNGEIGTNLGNVVIWSLGVAMGGKAIQTFGESYGAKKE